MIDVRTDAYREEAAELLDSLEVSLLELEERPADQELVATVFRALHTIKGSGAMFGFDHVAAFAHGVETVFDQVREGQSPVTPELISNTLAARDYIRLLLSITGQPPLEMARDGEAIVQRLRIAAHQPAEETHSPPMAVPLPHLPIELADEPGTWRVRFEPFRDFLLSGSNPLLLFDELRQFGELTLMANVAQIPMLREIDPTECHISWSALLTTAAEENAIRDVFIFVEDRAKITIERVESDSGSGSAVSEAGPVANTTAPVDACNPAKSDLRDLAQQHERTIEEKRRDAEASSTLRVPAARLDRLVNIVGELVTVQARLSGHALGQDDPELCSIAEEVERLTEMLRQDTMNIRMLPIRETFTRFKRLVRDLSCELGKKAELVTDGEDTELDKTVIDQLSDPLVHLVRNAIGHGIESPANRMAAGKPSVGRIRLSASHAGAFVLIRISDDGAGLNRAAIRERAVERGLLAADAICSDADLDAMIFAPGFSTAAEVTAVSGRGVGMDVVQRSMDTLRGTLSVTSTPGQGTSVTLRIPLTLAIIEGLLVEAGGSRFVVPLANVSECIELQRSTTARSRPQSLVPVRDEQVPFVVLRERFTLPGDAPPIEQVIIAETNEGRFGVVVDRVIGDHHAVIKKLGGLYRHVEEVSGATILGDGSIALVLDVSRLAAAVAREQR